MNSIRWLKRNPLLSHLRIASGTVLFMAAGIAFFAAMNPTLIRAGSTHTYIVLYKQQSVSKDAVKNVAKAGGIVVANYNAIGVVIARSENDSFRSNLMKTAGIQGVAATDNF